MVPPVFYPACAGSTVGGDLGPCNGEWVSMVHMVQCTLAGRSRRRVVTLTLRLPVKAWGVRR